MIMQVHDELVLEVPEDELQVVSEGLMQRMESCQQTLEVPLLVDLGCWE